MSLVERIKAIRGERLGAIKGLFSRDGEVERFHCRHCGEVFETRTDPEDVRCPVCGHSHLRAISAEG